MGELIPNGAACHINYPKYVICADGNIISFMFKKTKILTPGRRGTYMGYTLLDKSGRHISTYAHRVIAETFYGTAPNGYEVRHVDGNKFNNSLDNLRWGTRKENAKDRVIHGTASIGEKHGMAKLTNREVKIIRQLHSAKISTKLIMQYFKISRMTHNRIINRKLWKHVD